MIYHTREEVERIGLAGSAMWVDPKGLKGTAFRYLSSFWLFVEERDEAFTPHGPQGFWEAWITTWMSKQFDKHDHFVDVGANVGYYTMMGCAHGIPTLAYEPNPEVLRLLEQSVRLNNFHATTSPYALSDATGPSKLYIPERHSGGAYVGKSGIDIHTLRASDGLPIWPDRVLIKIDAEGHEPYIMDGMKQWCEEQRAFTVLLEWDGARYPTHQFAIKLFNLGEVFYVDFDGNEVPLIHPLQLAQLEGLQMVGVRK